MLGQHAEPLDPDSVGEHDPARRGLDHRPVDGGQQRLDLLGPQAAEGLVQGGRGER